ncbi:MAG: DSD1 family PLP-dependent enzyme [Chloroflexi bacterium]|nr:DSD1 family PLP-dependent enzyme [Chloroflexota bacterium]
MSEIGIKKSELDTPVLWVDLDLLESNIAALAKHFKNAGIQWRPHTKGNKVPAIAHMAINAGAIGVTCAKLGEAEVMAAAGIKDILIANEIVGQQKIARLVNLCRRTDVKVAVDSAENAVEMGAAALDKGVEVGVLVELDTGMHRSGVQPGAPAVALSRLVHQTPGLRYLGLMAWEGHASVDESLPWKHAEIEKSVNLLTDSVAMCREAGLPVSIVSGGGSGTYLVTPFIAGVTEIQAGGAIFSDVSYHQWGVKSEPCLFVRARVTSRPTSDRLIFDSGFKTLPDWAGKPKPLGLPRITSIGMSAEHCTVILEAPNDTIKVGDTYDFMIGYGDATVFLHDQMYGIRNNIVEVVWDIQGRGKLR